jgi:hypothetical protein
VRLTGLRELGIRSLDVFARARGATGQFTLSRCRDVTIERCTFRALDENPPDLVVVGGARRIRIVGNVFDAHVGSAFDVISAIVELLRIEDPSEVTLAAARLAEEIVADQARRSGLVREIDVAREIIGNMTIPEQRAYAALREALAVEQAAGPIAGAVLAVHDAAAHAFALGALAIADGNAETLVEDNVVVGYLTLYGPSIEDAALRAGDLKQLHAMLATGRGELAAGSGTINVPGNRISRVTLDEGTLDAIRSGIGQDRIRLGGLFRGIHLTDNTISPGQNLLLAGTVELTGNQFDPVRTDVGGVIGESALYTGNAAPAECRIFHAAIRRADAANLLAITNV